MGAKPQGVRGTKSPRSWRIFKVVTSKLYAFFGSISHIFTYICLCFFHACRHHSTKSAKWGHLIPFAPFVCKWGQLPPPAPPPMKFADQDSTLHCVHTPNTSLRSWHVEYDCGLQSTSRCIWPMCIEHIPCTAHITNEEVRHRTSQPPVTSVIAKRRLHLFGLLARADPSQDHSRILRAAINRPPADWQRWAGRPRQTWLHTIELDLRPTTLVLTQRGCVRRIIHFKVASACEDCCAHWWARYSMMRCCKVDSPITDGLNTDLHLDIGNGISLEKVDKFCYLGDMLDADGGCTSTVTAIVRSAWKKYPF